VARGAWLPDLTFSTTGTLSSATVANLLSSPLRSWSVGAQLAQGLPGGVSAQAGHIEGVADAEHGRVLREAGDSNTLRSRSVYELDLVARTYHDTYMADTVALAGSLKKKQIAYLSLT